MPWRAMRSHAGMAGRRWLTTSSSASTTHIIAVRRDETRTMQLLVGRHHDFAVADVSIHVLDHPYGSAGDSVHARVDRIPHFPQFYTSPPKAIPWPDGPVPHGVSTIALTGSSFQFDNEGFAEGDAYAIEIEPVIATTGIASTIPHRNARQSCVCCGRDGSTNRSLSYLLTVNCNR